MPSGKNLPVWDDPNPPPGDDPIGTEPYLWMHPQHGPLEVTPRSAGGGMVGVTQEYFDANAFSEPTAEEQAVGLGGVTDPDAGGILGSGVTASETNTVRPAHETSAQYHERKAREEAAKGVAVSNYQKQMSEADDPGGGYGGLSLGERPMVQQLIDEGLAVDAAEATALIIAEREKQALDASGQADALAPEDPGTRGVPSP